MDGRDVVRDVEERRPRVAPFLDAARPADAAALSALHIETWAEAYRDRVPEAFYRERLAAHRARDWAEVLRDQAALGGGVLLARCAEDVCGLCQYGPTDDEDHDPRRVGHVHRLYVHPRHQRAGVGRSLLSEATQRLRERGMSVATLWALKADERARAFYERLGWQPDGAERCAGAIDVRYRLLVPG
jgi:GNAT superfamily N-acetyltransferase